MSDLAQIERLMAQYFDGLYTCDVDALAQVFHPQAIYATASGGTWLKLALNDYLQRVAQRPSPQSVGHARTDEIEHIHLAGPHTALVRARCSIPGRSFVDLLTLVKVNQQWQIISKVFEFIEPEKPSDPSQK